MLDGLSGLSGLSGIMGGGLPVVSGLIADLKASTLSGATGDLLSSWSGGGTTVTASGANRPSYVAAADSFTGRPCVRFTPGGVALMTAAGCSADLRALTMVFVGRVTYRDTYHDLVKVGDNNGASGVNYATLLNYYTAHPLAQYGTTYTGANLGTTGNPYLWTRGCDFASLTLSASAAQLRLSGQANQTGSAAGTGLTASTLYVGDAQHGPCADYERVLVYSRGLSGTELDQLGAYLAAAYALPAISVTQPVVLVTGNSIHYGLGASNVANDIPSRAMAAIGLGLKYGSRWRDVSIPGQTSPDCVSSDPGRLTPYRNDSRATVVCWTEITNDIYLLNATGSVAYQHCKDYVAAIQTALPGAKVVLTTCLPRGGSYTARNACNASLRAAFPTTTAYSYVFLPTDAAFANCVLADWAAEPTMGPDGAEASATYYDAGNVHPSDAGCALLAPITQHALTVAGVF